MAKKKASEKAREEPTIAVKVDRTLAMKAKLVASSRGLQTAEYVSEAMRAVVERDWKAIVKQVDKPGDTP